MRKHMTDQPSLELKGVTKVLGGRTIVDDLDLSVARGELVCLLGPSGCGKTTTLRMVAGFLTPDTGSIVVEGADVTALPPERRPSAMVFQSYALWPHMTVFKNVAFPLRLKGVGRAEIRQRVEAALELVNLVHHMHSRPSRVSGGEQQRVALARALVQEPQLLLLDEPLSNLDARLRIKVREEIREIQQRLGITTLLVTHDQDEALSVSDRIAVMNGGRIEQVSAPSQLYAEPETEFVATFVGSLNRLDGRLDAGRLVDGPEVTAIRPEDVTVLDHPDAGTFPATVTRVIPHGSFVEVVLDAGDRSLRAFRSGRAPEVGSAVHARVERTMTFLDGRRVS
jgi:putative spermidine/putrescine transport system ATP-binding protein